MDQTKPSAHTATEDTTVEQMVAERLRRLRKANGLSLRQLGDATGMSASFLSQLERGLTGASTSTLIRIANCYGTSISELFSSGGDGQDRVLRRAMRPALPMMHGQRKTLLSRRPLTQFEAYVAEFEVSGSSGDEPYSHGDSHEMILVLSGRVKLELGDESHVLEDGDSAEYATSILHRVENIGDGPAEVLFVISPPTSTATYLDGFRRTGG